MNSNELSRTVKVKAISEEPYLVAASADEKAVLATRFDLPAIHNLEARLMLTPNGSVITAEGLLSAAWTQICAVSGEEFTVTHNESLAFHFVPARTDHIPDEEVELEESELDEIEYSGDSFDLGEAVAQSFGLTIDPYATGPNADQAREEKGIQIEGEQDGPLAEMLAGIIKE